MNTDRDLRIASKSNAVPVARWWRTFCGLSHTACYTVFDGAFQPLILLDFFRARIFFNPLLYRLSYRARGGIVTGKTAHFGRTCDPPQTPACDTEGGGAAVTQGPDRGAQLVVRVAGPKWITWACAWSIQTTAWWWYLGAAPAVGGNTKMPVPVVLPQRHQQAPEQPSKFLTSEPLHSHRFKLLN